MLLELYRTSVNATDLAAIIVVAASLEANTCPPSSINADVPATAVTTAADVTDNAYCNPDANVDCGPSPTVLDDDADDGGAGNTSMQKVAVMSWNAAKSALHAYFKGVNWPLIKALPKGA